MPVLASGGSGQWRETNRDNSWNRNRHCGLASPYPEHSHLMNMSKRLCMPFSRNHSGVREEAYHMSALAISLAAKSGHATQHLPLVLLKEVLVLVNTQCLKWDIANKESETNQTPDIASQNAAELASTAQSSFAPRRSTRKRHRNTGNVHLQTRNEKRAEHQDTTSPDAAKSSSTALQSPRLPRRPTEKENRHHWVRSCF